MDLRYAWDSERADGQFGRARRSPGPVAAGRHSLDEGRVRSRQSSAADDGARIRSEEAVGHPGSRPSIQRQPVGAGSPPDRRDDLDQEPVKLKASGLGQARMRIMRALPALIGLVLFVIALEVLRR